MFHCIISLHNETGKVGSWYLDTWKKNWLFAYGGRKFLLKSNIMMHFCFLFADVMRLTKTVTDANHYLNAKMACLMCPSQKLQLPLRDFAMSWSAASPSVRHDLSSRFRSYNSIWDLNCSYPSWQKIITSNQSVFITTFILILMLCFHIRLPLPPGAFSGLWKNQEAFKHLYFEKFPVRISLFFKLSLRTSL